MVERVLFSWSGGKDSVLAFQELGSLGNFEILSFLTSINEDFGRISMHGVRTELLEMQVSSIGFALEKVLIPKDSSNEEYENRMKSVLEKFAANGLDGVVFGDIFLEDLKKYREKNLAKMNLKGFFPLWKKNTLKLANDFIESGFRAIVTCVDSKQLGKKFVGREFDKKFLSELPENVDPCGENGEFHTFVFSGPVFRKEIKFKKGKIVLKNKRFYYCDLLPEKKV